MSFMSDYEKQRAKNIEENKKVLAGLGFDKPFSHFPSLPKKPALNKQVKRKRIEVQRPRKERALSSTDCIVTQSSVEDKPTRRRSGRLLGKEPSDFQGLDFELEEEEERPKKIPRNRENVFGAIPGIEVGTTWSTRLACSADGVHRPTVAGIHGNAEEGCYSLALSGGYEDDLDYGECFTYTGEGGRDLKGTKANPKNLRTAPQSKDQTLTRGNLALTKNIEKGRSVRVLRGYKLSSPFAPDDGYRYDGIYTVEKYWKSVGMSGFMVYKFALKRCENQSTAVWDIDETTSDSNPEEQSENTTYEENIPNTVSGNSNHENGVFEENKKDYLKEEMNGEKEDGNLQHGNEESDTQESNVVKAFDNKHSMENGGGEEREKKEHREEEMNGEKVNGDNGGQSCGSEPSEQGTKAHDIMHENSRNSKEADIP